MPEDKQSVWPSRSSPRCKEGNTHLHGAAPATLQLCRQMALGCCFLRQERCLQLFQFFAQSLSSCSCLATDKHLIGRGNEQRWSCLGMKAEASCLTKSFLKHTGLRDLPATIFFVALTGKRSDYRVAVWLGSLQLTTKQLAEENGFKQLLLSGHKQDVCYAGCKPQTKWIKQRRQCCCHAAKAFLSAHSEQLGTGRQGKHWFTAQQQCHAQWNNLTALLRILNLYWTSTSNSSAANSFPFWCPTTQKTVVCRHLHPWCLAPPSP